MYPCRNERTDDSLNAEGRKAQVTTGPPCYERNRIFFYFCRVQPFARVHACCLRTYGRIKFGSEFAVETVVSRKRITLVLIVESKNIYIYICYGGWGGQCNKYGWY